MASLVIALLQFGQHTQHDLATALDQAGSLGPIVEYVRLVARRDNTGLLDIIRTRG